MLQQFSDWLGQTYLSSVLADTTHMSTWMVIPLSQSLHILAVAFIMISVSVLNLRMLRVTATNSSFAGLTKRLMPGIWAALAVLFITGALQTVAEPSRELLNGTFLLKMVLLLVVVAICAFYQATVRREPKYWELTPQHQRIGTMLATTSLVLWFAILAAGRLIAYVDLAQGF